MSVLRVVARTDVSNDRRTIDSVEGLTSSKSGDHQRGGSFEAADAPLRAVPARASVPEAPCLARLDVTTDGGQCRPAVDVERDRRAGRGADGERRRVVGGDVVVVQDAGVALRRQVDVAGDGEGDPLGVELGRAAAGAVGLVADADEQVATEAARAISDDGGIEAALPALARALDERRFTSEPLLRRAINANLRLGTNDAAARVAACAADLTRSAGIRAEAAAALATWQAPSPFDRVDGAYHGAAVRQADAVRW